MGFELRNTKVSAQDIADVARHLAAFLQAGIPIIDAVDVLVAESDSKPVKALLVDIGMRIREGESLSECITAHADDMPPYFPGIIRSAELSGRLDVVLDQLADYVDRDEQARKRVKAALTYPGILAAMSTVTVVIMIGFVLPKFKGFFAGMDAKLPLSTRMLLSFGEIMKTKGVFIATGLAMVGLLITAAARTERGKLARDRWSLRLPVLRDIVQAAVTERFCRILSAMVSGGIPIADGMTAAIESSNNRVYSSKLSEAAREMLEGGGFASPIAATGLFPGMVMQMMRVGEDTGTLDRQLDVAANFYERELSFRLNKMTALFEPAVIVGMGLVVGFIAVALVQAMFGVYSQSGA